MRPDFDTNEDLGSADKRYRRVHTERLVTSLLRDESGVSIDVLKIVAGTAGAFRLARGVHTTVAAVDTVATGLTTVVAVVVSLGDDPGDDPCWVSATIGDQAGAPVAGSVIIKTWKNTGGTDPTPAAATTFTKKVNLIAIGT